VLLITGWSDSNDSRGWDTLPAALLSRRGVSGRTESRAALAVERCWPGGQYRAAAELWRWPAGSRWKLVDRAETRGERQRHSINVLWEAQSCTSPRTEEILVHSGYRGPSPWNPRHRVPEESGRCRKPSDIRRL